MIYTHPLLYTFTDSELEAARQSAARGAEESESAELERVSRAVVSDARSCGLRCGRRLNDDSWLFGYPDGSTEIRPANFSKLPGFVMYDPDVHTTADPRWRMGGPRGQQCGARVSQVHTAHSAGPTSYLKERFSGNFMSFDTVYEMGRGERISFDSKCKLHTENTIFCASHLDDDPLASVRAGSLFIGGNAFHVARCLDTPDSRRLVSDVRQGRLRHMSMNFALDHWYVNGSGVKVVTEAWINHISASLDPMCPFTSISVHK